MHRIKCAHSVRSSHEGWEDKSSSAARSFENGHVARPCIPHAAQGGTGGRISVLILTFNASFFGIYRKMSQRQCHAACCSSYVGPDSDGGYPNCTECEFTFCDKCRYACDRCDAFHCFNCNCPCTTPPPRRSSCPCPTTPEKWKSQHMTHLLSNFY